MWQLLAITSALFSASAAIFEKKALQKMHPVLFSLVLAIATLLVSLPLLSQVNFDSISSSAIGVLYIKSVLGAAAFLLVMYGIKKNDLSNSLPLLVITPAIVAVAAYFILDESFSRYAFGGMTLLLIGSYFLQLKKGENWKSPFKVFERKSALWYIFGAIIIFSITSILDKTLLKNYKLQPEVFIPLQQLFFSLNFFLLFLFTRKRQSKIKEQIKSHWKVILAIAVFAFIYRYSHILAIKEGPVALVLAIKRTSVFFVALIGGSYFRESNQLRRSLATPIMVVGTAIILIYG